MKRLTMEEICPYENLVPTCQMTVVSQRSELNITDTYLSKQTFLCSLEIALSQPFYTSREPV
jgi:hypothetical protein